MTQKNRKSPLVSRKTKMIAIAAVFLANFNAKCTDETIPGPQSGGPSVVTSDTFSASGATLAAYRKTNAALGGTSLGWYTFNGEFSINSNQKLYASNLGTAGGAMAFVHTGFKNCAAQIEITKQARIDGQALSGWYLELPIPAKVEIVGSPEPVTS